MAVSLKHSNELRVLTTYAAEKLNETKRLANTVSDMGCISRFRDSKVPDRDRTWYHFFSLKTSNKQGMLNDIRKYREFFEELNTALMDVREGTEDPRKIISDLLRYLSKMAEEAEHGSYTTGSSTVYELHNSFIKKHDKLEHMIKNVECLALNEMLEKEEEKRRELMEGLRNSKEYIDNLTNRYNALEEKYEDMCGKFRQLMKMHENVLADQGAAICEYERKQQHLSKNVLARRAENERRLDRRLEDFEERLVSKLEHILNNKE